MALAIRFSSKTIKTFLVILLIAILGTSAYFASIKVIIPKYFPNLIKKDVVVYDESKFPPIKTPEDAGLFPDVQEILSNKEYSFNISSLGNPAYTFRYYYKNDWLFKLRDSSVLAFTNEDGNLDFNMRIFSSTSPEYSMTCSEVVKELYPSDKLNVASSKEVTIFETKWNRVEYSDVVDSIDYIGISQCLKKDGAVFIQTLYGEKSYIDDAKPGILKVVDDIKINAEGVSW